jgi:hypothetical protein
MLDTGNPDKLWPATNNTARRSTNEVPVRNTAAPFKERFASEDMMEKA